MGDRVYAAERIMKQRLKAGKTEYLVKWKGWGQRHSTWEPEENILDMRLIEVFGQSQRAESRKKAKRKEKEKERLARERQKSADEDENTAESSHDESDTPLAPEKPLSRVSNKHEDKASESSDDAPLTGLAADKEAEIEAEKCRDVSEKPREGSEKVREVSEKIEKPRELAGTKRKAEVLSKESGKIGVTITTSPSGSGHGSPPPKAPKVKEPLATPIVHKPEKSPTPVRKSPDKQLKPLSAKQVDKTPIRRPSVARPSENESERARENFKVVSPPIIPASGTPRPDDHKKAITPVSTGNLPLTGGSLSPPLARGEEVPRQKRPQQPQETHTLSQRDTEDQMNNNRTSVLIQHPAEYWRLRSPVADQVFITDVTVNLETVTIRECKTEKGFFKDRPNNHVK